jgi:hypothetical protein
MRKTIKITVYFGLMFSLSSCMISHDRYVTNNKIYQDDVVEKLSRCSVSKNGFPPFIIAKNRLFESDDSIRIDLSESIKDSEDKVAIYDSHTAILREIGARKLDGSVSAEIKFIDWQYTLACNLGDRKEKDVQIIGLTTGSKGRRILRRGHYIYTVPLDIVTLPLQAIFFVYYFMNGGH